MAELFHEVQRSHKPGRKRPVFFIVFRPFGSDCITAVFHRIVNECKRSDTRLSGRLRPLLTVHDTIKTRGVNLLLLLLITITFLLLLLDNNNFFCYCY
jgi:hypothetical protein